MPYQYRKHLISINKLLIPLGVSEVLEDAWQYGCVDSEEQQTDEMINYSKESFGWQGFHFWFKNWIRSSLKDPFYTQQRGYQILEFIDTSHEESYALDNEGMRNT